MTDATVERTMAAAAEKPFMMLSVYLTTTDVYRPPTLARTESRTTSRVAQNADGRRRYCTHIRLSTRRAYSQRRSLFP